MGGVYLVMLPVDPDVNGSVLIGYFSKFLLNNWMPKLAKFVILFIGIFRLRLIMLIIIFKEASCRIEASKLKGLAGS